MILSGRGIILLKNLILALIVIFAVVNCPELETPSEPLQAPENLSPSNNVSISSTKPTFSWDAVEGANGYNLQLANSKEAVLSAPIQQTSTNSYVPEIPLSNLQAYYWRVKALSDSGTSIGKWSDITSLNIQWGTISGISPTDGSFVADTTPTLSWDAVEGVSEYQLQIAENQAGLDEAVPHILSTNSYTPTEAFTNFQTYYWRVKALDSNSAEGEWSSVVLLNIKWGTIENRSPADLYKMLGNFPTLSWDAVEGVGEYTLQIADSEEKLDAADLHTLSTNSYTQSTNFTLNTSYYWRVRAISTDSVEGEWSSAMSFDIIDDTISGLSPVNASTSFATKPTLSWDAIAGIDNYELQFATSKAELDTADMHKVGSNSYAPSPAFNNLQKYFWRVRGTTSDGLGGKWSSTTTLAIGYYIMDKVKLTLTGHTNNVVSISYSPDGNSLASGSADNTLKIWNASTGILERTLTGHSDGIRSIRYRPDGNYLASASLDNTIRIWNLATGNVDKTFTGTASTNSVAYSPDGKYVAGGFKDKTIKVWEIATGNLQRTYTVVGESNYVAYSPDGAFLASGSNDRIKIWDTATGNEKHSWQADTGSVHSLSYSLDGKYLASGWLLDEGLRVWDISTNKIAWVASLDSIVFSISYSPDNKNIASGEYTKGVKIFDANTGNLEETLDGHTGGVFAVSYSPDGKYLASGGGDNTIKIWE